MTARELTVTDHLLEASAILDKDTGEPVTVHDLDRVRDCLERALAKMSLLRCEAQTAPDKM